MDPAAVRVIDVLRADMADLPLLHETLRRELDRQPALALCYQQQEVPTAIMLAHIGINLMGENTRSGTISSTNQ